MRRWLALCVLPFVAACNMTPRDPFRAAESAMQRNDLLRALRAYDTVSVAHERYPDARAAAGELELRMRRCHELILEALLLRAEWRDKEALVALRRARDHWPGQPNLNQWIAATEQRMRLFGDHPEPTVVASNAEPAAPLLEVVVQDAGEGPTSSSLLHAEPASPIVPNPSAVSVAQAERSSASSTPQTNAVSLPVTKPHLPLKPLPGRVAVDSQRESSPVVVKKSQQQSASPLSEVGSTVAPAANNGPAKVPVEARPAAPSIVANTAAAAKSAPFSTDADPVALGLVSVEVRLGRGELVRAVRDLIELSRRSPNDERINRRLSRLLQQRALMNYGQGSIAAAISDWQRVLEIEPGNESVKEMLRRAQADPSHIR